MRGVHGLGQVRQDPGPRRIVRQAAHVWIIFGEPLLHERGRPRLIRETAGKIAPDVDTSVVVLQKRCCEKSEPLVKLTGFDYFTPRFLESRMSSLGSHLIWPLRITCTASYPNRPPRSIKRSKASAGVHPALDRSMVLLHYIVQIRASSTGASAPELPFLLQLRDHLRVGRVAIRPWIHEDDVSRGEAKLECAVAEPSDFH